jgi:porin
VKRFTAACLVLALWPGAVVAQDAYRPAIPLTSQATSPLDGTALQPLVRLGQDLLDDGVLLRLRTVDSIAGNPSGGISQGADANGVVIFGADFDLNRIAGLTGTLVHASFAQLYGHDLATDHIGDRTKVQTDYYPYKQFELSELTVEQSLFNDRLNVLVGRANATGEFARDTYGCRFEGVADCPFELTQLVGAFPGFPYVNWGGRVRVRLDGAVSIKAGAYELNSDRNRNQGFDWNLNDSTGFVSPVELAYETTFATDPMPRHYKLGFWYNSAAYSDPYLNTKGTSRGQFGGAALTYPGGRGGWYAIGDQVIWRHDDPVVKGASERGIALFATAGAPFDRAETFVFQGTAGAVWTGPFDARPADSINAIGSFLRLSDKEVGYLNALLTKAHSDSFISHAEFVFEVNYAVQAVPGVIIQPAVQYLVNPDDINRSSSAKFAPKDALVLGVKFTFNAGVLLGLPQQLPAYSRSGGL